jgi:hypothetical protein
VRPDLGAQHLAGVAGAPAAQHEAALRGVAVEEHDGSCPPE